MVPELLLQEMQLNALLFDHQACIGVPEAVKLAVAHPEVVQHGMSRRHRVNHLRDCLEADRFRVADVDPQGAGGKGRRSLRGSARAKQGSCPKREEGMPLDDYLLTRARRRPQDLRFSDALRIAEQLGFHRVRIEGSHHIFTHPEGTKIRDRFPHPLNLQEGSSGKAKPYQVKQMLRMAEALGIIAAK